MTWSWLCNGSMEAHHLLYAYLAVWAIQGGYACWVAVAWLRARNARRSFDSPDAFHAQRTRSRDRL